MEKNSESKKVFKGLGSQSVVAIIQGLLGLLNFSILSRLLDKEIFGLFAILLSVKVVLSEISNAGLGASVIQKTHINKDFYSTAFTLSFIIGVFFMLLLFCISGFLSELFVGNDVLSAPFKVMAISLFMQNMISIFKANYMRNLNFLRYGMVIIIASLLSYIVGIAMSIYGLGLWAIVLSTTLDTFLIATFLAIRSYKTVSFCISKVYIKEIVSYGGWLTASGVVRSVYEQMDKLLTPKWISVISLGSYNRPSGFVFNISSSINGIFDTVLFPILSSIHENAEKMKTAYMKASVLTFQLSIMFSCVLVLGAYFIVYIFFGCEWLNLVPIFQIASITVVPLFYGRIGDSFFRSTGFVKSYFYIRVTVCFLSVALIYLGCKYGIIGLALSVLLCRTCDIFIKIYVLGNKLSVSSIDLLCKIFRDSWFTSLLFLFCFLITAFFPGITGSIIATTLFVLFMVIAVLVKPVFLGKDFCDSICPIIDKMFHKIKERGL